MDIDFHNVLEDERAAIRAGLADAVAGLPPEWDFAVFVPADADEYQVSAMRSGKNFGTLIVPRSDWHLAAPISASETSRQKIQRLAREDVGRWLRDSLRQNA
jgi:hypothetical protein